MLYELFSEKKKKNLHRGNVKI